MIRVQGNIGASAQASFLAVIVGSFPAALLFAAVTMLSDDSRDWSFGDLVLFPGVAALSGLLGWLFAIPTTLLLGTPLAWRFGDRMAVAPGKAALPVALLGGACGWAIFPLLFDSDRPSVDRMWRDGCLIFGFVVAAALPFVVAWLDEQKSHSKGPESSS